jgi:DNA-binding ferritin-like protein (Dps family)
MAWYEKIVGDLSAKKQWREYRRRLDALPEPYRRTAAALERYLLNLGPTNKTESLMRMVTDLVDLLEQGAADRTPVRDLVGEDPAGFAEEFMANYGDDSWIGRERARLAQAVDEASRTQD